MITHKVLAVKIEQHELLLAESYIVNEKNDKLIKEIIIADEKILSQSA